MEHKIITTPNWTGLMPYWVIIGKNTGIVMTRMAIPSIKQPSINKTKMNMAMITFGLELSAESSVITCSGMR